MKVRISAQPIGWTNDDIPELGDETSLEQCLSEMKEAGYEGTELGRKFPREAAKLKAALKPYGLVLASGWHDLLLLKNSYEEEERRFLLHMNFLKEMGCEAVVAAECSRNLYGPPNAKMRKPGSDNGLSQDEWKRLIQGIESLSKLAREHGMRLAYHHHMGTVIQNQDEIDRLMRDTQAMSLLVDTGHALYAGVDPVGLAKKYGKRVAHVHLKDIRKEKLALARAQDWSFEKAVREGVFTVPGDGSIDYPKFLGALDEAGYNGWLVVEAEQDPKKANPLEYARKGRQYLKTVLS
jgi:inosose dehydratase